MQKPTGSRTYIGNAPIDGITLEDASRWVAAELLARKLVAAPSEPLQVMGPNAFLVTLAKDNPHFSTALRCADLVLPDGMSVVWGARLLGSIVPERVPGGEFMERLCALCAERDLSVYLLGGLPGAADRAAAVLRTRYHGLRIAGTDCPDPGFEHDESRNAAVRAKIEAARPDLLCVALGAPKQELWMLDECPTLPVGAVLSVGAAFDTLAGLRQRSPAWTHNIGLEWLYRLAMEPRRLWRRYLIGNLRFLWILAQTWSEQRKNADGYVLARDREIDRERQQTASSIRRSAALHFRPEDQPQPPSDSRR